MAMPDGQAQKGSKGRQNLPAKFSGTRAGFYGSTFSALIKESEANFSAIIKEKFIKGTQHANRTAPAQNG